MKNEIHLYHPNGTKHRAVPIRVLPQRRALKLVRVARVDGYVLGVSTRGTIYSVDAATPRGLRRNYHLIRSFVKCLELLGAVTPAEMKATLDKIEKDRLAKVSESHRYGLARAADALGVKLNKTQRRKAGLL